VPFKSTPSLRPEAAPPPDKKCPFCAETIKAEAIVCRFCGRNLVTGNLSSQTVSAIPARKSSLLPKILAALVILGWVVGGFFAYSLWHNKLRTKAEVKAKAEAAPVAELQEIMKIYSRKRNEDGVIKSTASDYSFNVNKTDSLVSPLTATVEFFLNRGANDGKEYMEGKEIATFAYQDRRWVVKSVCSTIRYPSGELFSSSCDDRGSSSEVRDVLKRERGIWEEALKIMYSHN